MDLPQLAKLIDETTAFFKKEQEAILVQVNDPQQTEAGNAQMLQIQASTIQSAYRRIEAIQRAFSEWVETLPDKEQTEAPPLSGGAVTVDEPFLQELLGQVEERFQSIEHGLDILSQRLDQVQAVPPPLPQMRGPRPNIPRKEPTPEQRWGGGAIMR